MPLHYFAVCLVTIVAKDIRGTGVATLIQMWVNSLRLPALSPLWCFSPTQCITSIMVRYACFVNNTVGLTSSHKVGRMMMNLRGLILQDPGHTTHLKTLEFVANANSVSKIEDETQSILAWRGVGLIRSCGSDGWCPITAERMYKSRRKDWGQIVVRWSAFRSVVWNEM